MEKQLPLSFLPEKCQILSGSALKAIAMGIMLIDHLGAFLLYRSQAAMQPRFVLGGTQISIYQVMRDIGRLAFPIFCFLLVEGFLHTRSRLRYGRNLFLFALISEIPWNLVHGDSVFYPEKQNVFFTLFLGYLAFCAIEHFQEHAGMQLVCMLALLAVSWYLGADYGYRGYIFMLIMYWLRDTKPAQAVIGSMWLLYEWKACFSYLLINMYNGKRGFIQGKWAKYAFYAFYPVHLAVLYLVRLWLYP